MKIILRIFLGLVVIAVLGFGYWRYDHVNRENKATPEAIAATASNEQVTVSTDAWITFTPADSKPTTGLIFYPGGEVDERGYSQPLREIAAAGYLVVVVPMPFQLAVFSPDSATEVIAAHPEIGTWAIAGHSLGGSMAARYAHHHPENVQGLLLWDAYPADDMSASTLKVRMIHRSDQAGNPPESYKSNLSRMPSQGDYYPLKGAQHLNFGSFVPGRMYADEPPPELDPKQQHELVINGSVEFLQTL